MANRLIKPCYLEALTTSKIQARFVSVSSINLANNDDNNRNRYKQQHVNYSTTAVEVSHLKTPPPDISTNSNHKVYSVKNRVNTNGYTVANKPSTKKSNASESRERFNNIRLFYTDPEIDKACERPLVRLNPMTMMYMGVSDDNSHLLQSANYLRNELPIRLAHMIKELRNLPFIVGCNPSMLDIHERCIKAFRNFDNFDKEIKDINTEKKFNQLVYEMLEMNKDLLALLCDGFKDTRKYIKNEIFIKDNLNKILSARLGVRLLCEHHIALNRQSNLNKILLSDEFSDDSDPIRSTNHNSDNFTSSYLTSNSGDSTNGTANTGRDGNWVGIIHKKFSPKKLIEQSGRLVTRICTEKYGISPKLKIDGHLNAQFPYLPLPLEYIIPEILKNSFRATYEHHYRNSPQLPDVSVTIAVNDKDFIIRIRDRGGGIRHELENKIFDYHFTTADESNEKNADELSADKNGEGFDMSGMGMICEASSSRGLAVMHGYGFGLPTSKAYAEYLGGSLTFQSMQGIGSDFYLRLGLLDIEPEVVRI